MFARCVCLLVGYVCGSILTAEIVTQLFEHRSIFEVGDGNPGMANVGHELGTPAALICLAGDILKTLIPVLVMNRVFGQQLGWAVVCGWTGLGATLGHLFPFWHYFKGGKGVTTIASTIVLMNPLWGIMAGVVGVATIILAGYLSVGAVVAMVFYTIVTWIVLPKECAFIALIFTGMQVATHFSKLMGIRDGSTRKASLSTKFWERFGRK